MEGGDADEDGWGDRMTLSQKISFPKMGPFKSPPYEVYQPLSPLQTNVQPLIKRKSRRQSTRRQPEPSTLRLTNSKSCPNTFQTPPIQPLPKMEPSQLLKVVDEYLVHIQTIKQIETNKPPSMDLHISYWIMRAQEIERYYAIILKALQNLFPHFPELECTDDDEDERTHLSTEQDQIKRENPLPIQPQQDQQKQGQDPCDENDKGSCVAGSAAIASSSSTSPTTTLQQLLELSSQLPNTNLVIYDEWKLSGVQPEAQIQGQTDVQPVQQAVQQPIQQPVQQLDGQPEVKQEDS
eukprot:TRINITY_DN1979_c0_g2_i3.p1 TRINITY_DN1979_c0_g2~~TRINITY_DN1979_c0_g2_i3.p1  ORF type:complete len:294 (+),score=79.18 TRINITY_DN1979_c0_g2_i3:569-1450(+)